jgi:anti-sigma regulatory factor (Ser/Thr protein kinase)
MAIVRQLSFPIDDPSQVSDVRRRAYTLAETLNFDQAECGRLALTITEAATNIIKHGGRGLMLLRPLSRGGADGLEVIAVDDGPGVKNVDLCMQDGYSTAGSPGTGLGSISRTALAMDIYSLPGKGFAMRFEHWSGARNGAAESFSSGTVTLPKDGEQVCGDSCAVKLQGSGCVVMVADGLGHGPDAARAAEAATAVVSRHPHSPPASIVETVHCALASTRGAAAAIAKLDARTGKGVYCGVGNIAAMALGKGRPQHLLSHHGTLGHITRRIQEYDFDFPKDALLIMFSDGLAAHWALDHYPGLAAKHPSVIAAVLCRDHKRGRDDVTVTVVRSLGS